MKTLEEAINNSVIIVDKHSGPTSHQVSGWLRDMLGLKKVGHTGTLDPAVTGVLPVVLGNSVKAMPLFSRIQKEYVGVMQLHKEVPREQLERVIEEFTGKITQLPPRKSSVARREREREIFSLDVIEFDGRNVLFRTKTEAGTYIRKLCHDIGNKLETGAHMAELRRTEAGPFQEKLAHSLTEIKDLYEFAKSGDEKEFRRILIPIEDVIPSGKKVFAKDSAIEKIVNGAPLYVGGVEKIEGEIIKGETLPIMSKTGELIAIGIAKMDNKEVSKRKKGTAVRTDRIIRRV